MNYIKIVINELGAIQTNCYFIINENIGEALIVDPADKADYIISKCAELQIKPAAILLTHGHFDHIGAAGRLKEAFNIPVYAGAAEKELLSDSRLNRSSIFGREPFTEEADVWLSDGETVELAGITVKIIATPGHTAGGICFYIESENVLFSGDTLFSGSFGRTDLPTGSAADLVSSIINKLFVYPDFSDETKVYPGHGPETSMGYEKKNNPVLTAAPAGAIPPASKQSEKRGALRGFP